jgi:hypothetical protein
MKTTIDFVKRMKTDKNFRRRVLAAKKEGLEALLTAEGYAFPLEELTSSLPNVKTNLLAGRISYGAGTETMCLVCA